MEFLHLNGYCKKIFFVLQLLLLLFVIEKEKQKTIKQNQWIIQFSFRNGKQSDCLNWVVTLKPKVPPKYTW